MQGVELLAGAFNLTLMGMNIRDGLKVSGRLRKMNQSLVKTGLTMDYSILKYLHVLGAVLMGAGLVGVWLADLRSRHTGT